MLLLRPDHIGDVLLTSPAVALLRESLPGAHLTYLVGPWSAEVARGGPPVDSLRVLAYPGFTRQANPNLVAPYALLMREAARLRRERYDVAVVFRPDHWWGALLALVAGIPVRVGGDTPETTPLLTHARAALPGEHAAATALELARLALQAFGPHAPPPRGMVAPDPPIQGERGCPRRRLRSGRGIRSTASGSSPSSRAPARRSRAGPSTAGLAWPTD